MICDPIDCRNEPRDAAQQVTVTGPGPVPVGFRWEICWNPGEVGRIAVPDVSAES